MEFGLKDIIDILIAATLLYGVYKTMKESGTLNIFIGVLAFIVLWVVVYKVLDMKLIGTIMDKFINIGLIILVELGSNKRWRIFRKLFSRDKESEKPNAWIIPVVYACMSMSKSKTGALIVIKQAVSLENYERTGDIINAKINTRLIENIFFKNSPLHDGALIISDDKLAAAGCIMPVSHDQSLPRYLGLRHRAALGIAQATDAIAIIVSEETGNISLAYKGQLYSKLTSTDLEQRLSKITE